MSHQIRADLRDLQALAAAVKDLQWYTGAGGYMLSDVSVSGEQAVWELTPQAAAAQPAAAAAAQPAAAAAAHPMGGVDRRRTVEPGDRVIVETKPQQMDRRFGGGEATGVEGVVFRVLTPGTTPPWHEGRVARPHRGARAAEPDHARGR